MPKRPGHLDKINSVSCPYQANLRYELTLPPKSWSTRIQINRTIFHYAGFYLPKKLQPPGQKRPCQTRYVMPKHMEPNLIKRSHSWPFTTFWPIYWGINGKLQIQIFFKIAILDPINLIIKNIFNLSYLFFFNNINR